MEAERTWREALDAPYPLAPEQVEAFRRDGYVRLRGVFPAELTAHYREVFLRLSAEDRRPRKAMEERSTYERAFHQVFNLWRRDDEARAFVFSRRLAGIAAGLLEVDGVRLYHDQALTKEAGGGHTPWHADQYYWPLSSDRTVTAWVPLQPVSLEMGPLSFSPGSQRMELGRDKEIGDEGEAMIAQVLADAPLDERPFEAGEVSFHGGWTFHRAGPNGTDETRAAMTVIYMDAAMRLVKPANPAQDFDRQAWCRGATVGEVIDGPLNPVLF